MFKVYKGYSPQIMSELFTLKGETRTRSEPEFEIPRTNTVSYGDMSLSSMGPKVWNQLLPTELKSITNITAFREKIKSWKPNCRCRLCIPYVQGVGFVN